MRRLGLVNCKLREMLLIVALLVISTSARADEAQQRDAVQGQTEQGKAPRDTVQEAPKTLTWDPAWPTFRPSEYVMTGLTGAAAIGIYLFAKPPSNPHWTGGILFDDAARDAFRLRSQGARTTARHVSDFTAAGAALLVLGVDSILIPLLRKNERLALQLTLMNLEAIAFSTFTVTSLFTTVGRARPSFEECQRDPNSDTLCRSGETASFPSGHANGAFTAAGLSCAHHGNLPLYGGGAADAAACIGSVALATTTASLRVLGDRHYVTDVLTSAGIGFGFGFGVPTLLHYVTGSGGEQSGDKAKFSLIPMGGNSQYGLMAVGSF